MSAPTEVDPAYLPHDFDGADDYSYCGTCDQWGRLRHNEWVEKWERERRNGSQSRGEPLAEVTPPVEEAPPEPSVPPDVPASKALEACRATFHTWLGEKYDTAAIDACLAAASVELLTGDPLWVLVVSGSGAAKTETVRSLGGLDRVVETSTITSEGALLSGTSVRERAADATGGLLPQIGERGLLIVKDVTSILSMNRDARGAVLGAMREVGDGRWARSVGTDGGRQLEWEGRIAFVGAVTTAWDRAHAVIAAMGDRFLLVRLDSDDSEVRADAAKQAMKNVGREVVMRKELRAAVEAVMAVHDPEQAALADDDELFDRLLAAADLLARARTSVDRDFNGNVTEAHAPEMPTRVAKQMLQTVRGLLCVGGSLVESEALAMRLAADSVPPARLEALRFIARAHPLGGPQKVRDVIAGTRLTRTTADRVCQELHQLGVLARRDGGQGEPWAYMLAEGMDPAALGGAQECQ